MKLLKAALAVLAAFACTAARAQSPDIMTYIPNDNEDYRGYSITNVRFSTGDGYVAAGNHTVGGNSNKTIHLLGIPGGGAGAAGALLSFADDDVRAVAVNEYKKGTVVLTVQLRNAGDVAKIGVVVLDYSSYTAPVVVAARTLAAYGGMHLYPLSATIDERTGTYYAGGFIAYQNGYPAEPTSVTDKYGMVAKMDLTSGTGNFSIMSTPIDYTMPQAAAYARWDSTFTDHDIVQKVKIINNELYAVGSCNGSSMTGWAFVGSWNVNTSKIFVARINRSTLYPMQTGRFGSSYASSMITPNMTIGYHGTDIIEDVDNPGSFYVTGQDIYWHTWTISQVDPGLQITPGTISPFYANSLTYNYPADIKGYGAFTQRGDRISLYGMVRAGGGPIPPDPSIADVNDGAIPFVASFEPVWGGSGLTANNIDWWVEGNLPSNPTYMPGIYSPYLMSGDMARFGRPQFATQLDAAAGKYDLAMMGHYGDGSAAPNISPRFILSDENGQLSTCKSSVQCPGTYPGVGPMVLEAPTGSTSFGFDGPNLTVGQLRVSLQKWNHTEYSCSGNNVYRQPQQLTAPGAVSSTGENTVSLYPNPATDRVTVDLGSLTAEGGHVSLSITDVTGRSVAVLEKASVNGSTTTFKLPFLSRGLYHCTVRLDARAVSTQKLEIH